MVEGTAAKKRLRNKHRHAAFTLSTSFVGFPEEDSMHKARLLSTVAATLLLSAGIASAQTMKKDEAPAPAPAAQQSAPAEKVAPSMKAGDKKAETHKAPETTGQAPNASDAGKANATDKGAMDKKASGAKADADVKSKSDVDVKPKAAAETKTPDSKAPATKASESKAPETKTNSAQDASGSKASPAATTGQGAAAGSAKLSTEQRTKITTIFKQHKVAPTQLNVSISVGTRVPESVHFYPIPTEVIVIYPEWRGYDYILVGDQILVVDPRTHEIVAILEA
jgi:Protein of unknown function (DUF1236)